MVGTCCTAVHNLRAGTGGVIDWRAGLFVLLDPKQYWSRQAPKPQQRKSTLALELNLLGKMRLNVILFGKRVVASPYSLGPLPTAPLAHHLLESLAR